MNRCKVCGGKMLGDGFTEVFYCEFIERPLAEPDANPVYCKEEVIECVEPSFEDTWSTWDYKVFETLPEKEARRFSKIR